VSNNSQQKGIRKSVWNRVKYSQDNFLVWSRAQAEASAFPHDEIMTLSTHFCD